jgi:hypothetical protein
VPPVTVLFIPILLGKCREAAGAGLIAEVVDDGVDGFGQ